MENHYSRSPKRCAVPIITISQDAYSRGEDISKKVAEKLGYECIGPELIQHACESLAFPYVKIHKALYDSPTFLEHIGSKRDRTLALFRAIFYEYMSRDNIVYHGLAGHIFMADIPNIIKIRVLTDFDERVRDAMRQGNLSFEKAEKKLNQTDKERTKWTRYLYGKDNRDPRLYDLYLNLQYINIDAAVAIITSTAQTLTNQYMEMTRKKLMDLALAAKTEARLLEVFPEVEVVARDREVFVSVKGSILQEEIITERAENIISEIKDIRSAKIGIVPSIFVPF